MSDRFFRRRAYRKTLTRIRAGIDGHWTIEGSSDDHERMERVDRNAIRRLIQRVAYGGRKGRRAFARLWAIGVRPSPVRVHVNIRGFEF